jgi:hypothetical protein
MAAGDKVSEILKFHAAWSANHPECVNTLPLKKKYITGKRWTSHKACSENKGGVGRAGLRTQRWWRVACHGKSKI